VKLGIIKNAIPPGRKVDIAFMLLAEFFDIGNPSNRVPKSLRSDRDYDVLILEIEMMLKLYLSIPSGSYRPIPEKLDGRARPHTYFLVKNITSWSIYWISPSHFILPIRDSTNIQERAFDEIALEDIIRPGILVYLAKTIAYFHIDNVESILAYN
jgi:hypothetical protein